MKKEIKAILLTVLTLVLIIVIPCIIGTLIPIYPLKNSLAYAWLNGTLLILVICLALLFIFGIYTAIKEAI